MISTPHQDDLVILGGDSTALCRLQHHPMKQVVPWTQSDAYEGITAMNAKRIWPHLLTQLHTNLIALARRTQACMESMDMIMDTIQQDGQTGLLKPLFEARLH